MPTPPLISVTLIVPDADAAVAWYQASLGATQRWNLGGVAGLEIGGAPFLVHQVNPANPAESGPGTSPASGSSCSPTTPTASSRGLWPRELLVPRS
ncbi:hypothetical protein AB0M48_02950 [Lentzea sp. NPDC051208]|uniref:VOC family protein n=1 Tax=Lentzea sp. NPDC051208 TaxID=3154642 RepID=UPI0034169F3C